MVQMLAKPVAEQVQLSVKARAARFKERTGRSPHLAVVLVGENPGSLIYVRRKGEMCDRLGIRHQTLSFSENLKPDQVKEAVERLNKNDLIDGILIQRPLPRNFPENDVVYWVAPEKDVDAFHPMNAGRLFLGLPSIRPCTPWGIMELLKFYNIEPSGKVACVIGRSSIVGKPMASLLLQANASLLLCHSKTPRLESLVKQADLVVAAVGKPGLITASFVRDGAVVIDVGINRRADGKVVGDVAYDEVAPKVSAITPVPGGVGPMTIAMLLQNTVQAAEDRVGS